MKPILAAVTLFIAALLLPAGNVVASSIKIKSISPDVSDPLVVGQTIKVTVTLDYVVDSDSGMVSMRVQKDGLGNTLIRHAAKVVKKGTGRISLDATITVPSTESVQVFTELYDRGPTESAAANLTAFNVIKKKTVESDSVWTQQLIGHWREIRKLSFGSDDQEIQFKDDGTFSVKGIRTNAGAITLFGFAGTWKVQDGTLHFSATSSSSPKILPVGVHYSDEILWVNEHEWAMIETDTGDVSKAVRLKARP